MAVLSRLLHVAAFLGASYAATVPSTKSSAADIVLQNGKIYTLDKCSSQVSALAIENGVITFVGGDAEVKPYIGDSTKVVDLKGRMAMPGLIDSHMHLLAGGEILLKCDFNYQPLGLEEVLKHLQGCIDGDTGKTDANWVEAVNLDYASLTSKSGPVTKKKLDALNTKRPVFIRSSDFHTVIVNSRALEVSNVTADTPDPPGGKIERLNGGKEPSGVLQDTASSVIAGPDPTTPEQSVEAGRAALRLLRQAGITTFQEAASGEEQNRVFRIIQAEGGLSARGYFDYRVEPRKTVDDVAAFVAQTVKSIHSMNDNSTITAKPSLKWQAIKAFMDGVITYPSSTAALIEPYWKPVNGSQTEWAPDPSSMNKPYWSPEILYKTLEGLFLAAIDAQIHVDGDLAVRVALDAAEEFRKEHPNKDIRLGLAHDELSHEDDWPRFAALDVDPIMSFQWAQPSSFYIPNTFQSLNEYRHKNLQAHARILEAGRPLVYGSDWPIDPLDEFLALKIAVTRSGDPENPNSAASQGAPYNGTFPGDPIPREAALRAITINGAKFLRANKHIGSLEKGKFADIIVLEKNYFEVPEEEIGRQKVLLTMLGGEVLYVAESAKDDFPVNPKFPNDDKKSKAQGARAIGGLDMTNLSNNGKQAVQRLRKRGSCLHQH